MSWALAPEEVSSTIHPFAGIGKCLLGGLTSDGKDCVSRMLSDQWRDRIPLAMCVV